jgi:hypothetical protein
MTIREKKRREDGKRSLLIGRSIIKNRGGRSVRI